MKDERKTKHQLISELNALRRQLDSPPSTVATSGGTQAAKNLSGDRFELLFNQSQDVLMVVDAQSGDIIDVNQAAGKILGYEKADLIGIKLSETFELDSGEDVDGLKDQLQIYGSVFSRTYPHPDGTNRFLDLMAAIIPWDTGQAILVTARDVTERKLVEKELWKKQQQLAKDLEVAAGIQQSLIPSYSPRIESIRVAWRFEPCEQIGGDIFNFHYAGRNHISFYMLDVCGHGVSSALISAAASQFLQTNYELSANASETVQPEAVLNSLERVFPFERFDSFFTIVYVTVDYVNGRMIYSCAGHPPPILLHADGELEVLDVHGSVIGAGDGRPFRQEENQLEHGDKIILYTDGVLDYPNPAGEIFGKQRFHKALQKHGRQPVQMLMDSVQMTIKDFAGSASSGDDLSIMAVEYV